MDDINLIMIDICRGQSKLLRALHEISKFPMDDATREKYNFQHAEIMAGIDIQQAAVERAYNLPNS